MILHIVTFSQATPGALCEETHYLHQNFIVLRKTEAMTLRMRCATAARCGGDAAESDGEGKRGGIIRRCTHQSAGSSAWGTAYC